MNNWFLLAAIPVFGVCVLVHGFGHFITAKWAGIRVDEFGIGFPPRLVGFRKRDSGGWEVIWFGGKMNAEDTYVRQKQPLYTNASGIVSAIPEAIKGDGIANNHHIETHTIYSINFLPIGGFVRMPGENGDINDPDGNYDPQSFAAKSAGKRLIVLVAGVTMNVLLAMVLFTFAFGFGEPKLLPQIGKVVPGSPAEIAGIRPGDTIVSANNQPVKFFSDLQAVVNSVIQSDKNHHATVPVIMQIRRSGSTA